MITASINLDKIPKDKAFKGETGNWLNLVLIETPNSKYGDYMIKVSQTKQDRERGEPDIILGNGKIWDTKQKSHVKKVDDELPF